MKSASALFLATMLVAGPVLAQQPSLSESDRNTIIDQVTQNVLNEIRKNPDIILKGLTEAGQTTAEDAGTGVEFDGSAREPSYGKEDAPYTIILFSDYGCSPCNDVEKIVYDLAMTRDDIRIVHNDYPVTSEDSVAASLEVIQAFNAEPQQNWLALRQSFIEKGVAPEYRIEALKSAGISPDSEVNTRVKITLLKNRELARRAGVTSLPAIIVMKGDGVVPISGDIDANKVNQALKLLAE